MASITQHKYVLALKKIVLSPAGMVLATLGLASHAGVFRGGMKNELP